MDRVYFEPSSLESEVQERLQTTFSRMTQATGEDYPFKLVFRSSEAIGANAFALPDGTIVITDDMVKLAQNDQQIMAVIAHEIGHVSHRHGLRRVLQHTGLSLMLIVVTGDIASVANLAAILPTLLLENSYSRDMETEADRYALSYMQLHGPKPENFAAIMTRLKQSYEGDGKIAVFLSSHPDIDERIKPFLEAG
jgi:predicted Zn-dependent protease